MVGGTPHKYTRRNGESKDATWERKKQGMNGKAFRYNPFTQCDVSKQGVPQADRRASRAGVLQAGRRASREGVPWAGRRVEL